MLTISLKTFGSITATNDADGNLTCMGTTFPQFAYDEGWARLMNQSG